jgi:hypothetical protein
MHALIFICIAAGFAFLAAWFVNLLVAWMSGEHPGDTGRQFVDVFFRILGVSEFGFIGRILDAVGGPVRWIIYIAAGMLIASALLRACSQS